MGWPDFICIGAQKAGTTWLDTNLRYHPDLWLPPAKEIHYFDRGTAPYIKKIVDQDPIQRYMVSYRLRLAAKEIARRALRPKAAWYAMKWYWRFLFGDRSDGWYRSLFAPAPGQLAGETTPGYNLLPATGVRRVATLMPSVKLIYLVRHPVERAWSQIRMRFSRFGWRGVETIPEEEVLAFLRHSRCLQHSRFSINLARWEAHFPAEQLFVGFFDDIAERPARLLRAIYRFLGVADEERFVSPRAGEKIFAGRPSAKIPPVVESELVTQLLPEVQSLHARFDNPITEGWLASSLARQRELEMI